jgi:hypothetical protein
MDRVFEAIAKKLCMGTFSNAWPQTTNAYKKVKGLQVKSFQEFLNTFLTIEESRQVNSIWQHVY